MTITTREAFERGTETFNAHDIEGFADVLADDVVWHIIDDLAVGEGTFTGTHDGTLYAPTGDIPPTGRPVEVDFILPVASRQDAMRTGSRCASTELGTALLPAGVF
jgi:hypothetical protein